MSVSIAELRQVLIDAGVETEVALAVRPDEALLKQGLDSVDFPAFAASVEDRYGVKIDEKQALSLRTLNDFLAFVAKDRT